MSKIEANISYYKKQMPQLAELLDFSNSIFSLKELHIKQMSPTLSIPKKTAIRKLESGTYLMENLAWSIDKNSFGDIIRDLIELLKQRGEKVEQIEKIFSNIPSTIPTKLAELLDLLAKDIRLAQKNTLSYILWQALSIFYQKVAETFKEVDYKLYWIKSICPVCGSLPKISRLEKEDGKRILACYLCWTEWLVPRIGCVYCGNNSQDMLKYFHCDGNESYRADVCNVCNKYIKTIDERLLDREVIMELEDNITYHLDTLAISEGYKNSFLCT